MIQGFLMNARMGFFQINQNGIQSKATANQEKYYVLWG